ncbi:MAG: rRNA maturation RNase YbeY [Alphaproteobacteria bacterium]|nr:rRNA maturation RNase YbeY [Alphaproteobacteria bacterium]
MTVSAGKKAARLTGEALVTDRRWGTKRAMSQLIRQACMKTADELPHRETALAAGAFSIQFTDDATNRNLNNLWRKIDKPTNVLAFPAPAAHAPDQSRYLGDISIAYETVLRESAEQGKQFEDHLRHMIVHGLLHLLGFDHVTEKDAARMEALEQVILARLGVADPYNG